MCSDKLGRSLNIFTVTLALFLATVTLVFSGCSSAGASGFESNSVNLLSESNSVYLTVPVTEYPELTVKILRKKAGLSEKNASKVVSRLTRIYAGIDFSSKSENLEMAAEGNFPSSLAGLVLTKKNGWEKKSHTVKLVSDAKEKNLKYNYFDGGKYGISFPSGSKALISNSVTEMLDRYAQGLEKSGAQFDWLENGDNVESDILFYITKPQSIVSSFMGEAFSTWFTAAYGNIAKGEEDGSYLMTFNLVLVDAKRKDLAITMMTLAGLPVLSSGENMLTISGIPFTEDQIMDFMSGGAN